MNKDQVSGKIDQAVGKVKQGVGEAVGDEKLANKAWSSRPKGRRRKPGATQKTRPNRSPMPARTALTIRPVRREEKSANPSKTPRTTPKTRSTISNSVIPHKCSGPCKPALRGPELALTVKRGSRGQRSGTAPSALPVPTLLRIVLVSRPVLGRPCPGQSTSLVNVPVNPGDGCGRAEPLLQLSDEKIQPRRAQIPIPTRGVHLLEPRFWLPRIPPGG